MVDALVIPAPAHPVQALARWAAEHCPDGGIVLDVGAGEHASGDLRPLRRRRAYLVGADPDPAIERNRALRERHRCRIEELGPEHSGRYDVVLSIFVLEHVDRPSAFASACVSVLRPGGSWFALTLNVRHYFGATARVTNQVGVQHALLHRLKGEAAEHDHRFPTRYRLNSLRTVDRVCRSVGFDPVEYRVYDAPDRYAWYLPQPLDRLPAVYSSVAYRIGRPGLMGHLTFRAQRPAS
ncbi:MAG: methyltransferase domain-containing protein [Nocardioides sp.]